MNIAHPFMEGNGRIIIKGIEQSYYYEEYKKEIDDE
jgi:fido (protein-threonine AMPylation protein)